MGQRWQVLRTALALTLCDAGTGSPLIVCKAQTFLSIHMNILIMMFAPGYLVVTCAPANQLCRDEVARMQGKKRNPGQELEFQGADNMPAYVELLTTALRDADAHLIRECALLPLHFIVCFEYLPLRGLWAGVY